jgi:hypothetical protein
MPTISLKAHFDGNVIRLDEPYEIPRDAQLLVTVLQPASPSGWGELSADGLSRAYGDDEPEYTAADLQP